MYAVLQASTLSTSNIVIGAHFDSVPGSPGANDNATGVAFVLAVARYLTSVDCRQSNVYFVLFDEEEIGLVGSYQFAQFLSNQGTDVVSVHTIDQMGWDQDNDLAVELERPSGNLYSEWVQSKTAAGLSMTLHQTDTGQTDHVSFRQFGFAAIGITEELSMATRLRTTTRRAIPMQPLTSSICDRQRSWPTSTSPGFRVYQARESCVTRLKKKWPADGAGHSLLPPLMGCRHAFDRRVVSHP